LRFLVIGGLAVIEHGYSRFTADIDLLIDRTDEEKWCEFLVRLGYQVASKGESFLQFLPNAPSHWPVDLMLVAPETFAGLVADASPVSLKGAQVSLVSINHLIALKLHVLKQAQLHRFLKDFQDIIELVRINHLDLHSEAMRGLFLRYGDADLYEKIKRAIE